MLQQQTSAETSSSSAVAVRIIDITARSETKHVEFRLECDPVTSEPPVESFLSSVNNVLLMPKTKTLN